MKVYEALICIGIGAGLGAGATYLIMKKKCNERIEKEVSEQVESVKESFRALREKKTGNVETECGANATVCEEPIGDEPVRVSGKDVWRPNVRKPIKEDAGEHLDVLTPNEPGYIEGDPDDEECRPYIIKGEDAQTIEDYDAVEWVLFKDRILCVDDMYCLRLDESDIKEYLYPDPDVYIDLIGWEEKYKESIYIRCPRLRTDVCIRRDDQEYGEWLLANGYSSRYDEELLDASSK